VKAIAKATVTLNPWIASSRFPDTMLWWAQVTEAPEVNKIKVFKNGTSHALKTSIPRGGHTDPISGVGAKAAQKNAQKKAKKNITSDTMNKTIPDRLPNCTKVVCCPSKVPSRTMSRHHTYMVLINNPNPLLCMLLPPSYPWKYITDPVVLIKAPVDAVNGHGLGSTK
jgi:hypothetical protein